MFVNGWGMRSAVVHMCVMVEGDEGKVEGDEGKVYG